MHLYFNGLLVAWDSRASHCRNMVKRYAIFSTLFSCGFNLNMSPAKGGDANVVRFEGGATPGVGLVMLIKLRAVAGKEPAAIQQRETKDPSC